MRAYLLLTSLFLTVLSFNKLHSQHIYNTNEPLGQLGWPVNLDSLKQGDISLDIQGMCYFKNNEYFSCIADGYTLPGYWIAPRLAWSPASRTAVKAGIYLGGFHGMRRQLEVQPILSVSRQLAQGVRLTLGTLDARKQALPDQLFDGEHALDSSYENGLQFAISKRRFEGDVWLNWREFIFKGDTSQEKLCFGIASRIIIARPQQRGLGIELPVGMVIAHHGGQTNKTQKPLLLRHNRLAGLCLYWQRDSLRRWGFAAQWMDFADGASAKTLPYHRGQGILARAFARCGSSQLWAEWWRAYRFYAQHGAGIYQSVSSGKEQIDQQNRNVIALKYYYSARPSSRIAFMAGGEYLYDLWNKRADYNFSLIVPFRYERKF